MLIHSPLYNTPLSDYGVNKPFALDRGELVLRQLQKELQRPLPLMTPTPITRDEALLVHTQSYLDSLSSPKTWMEIFELDEDDYAPTPDSKPLNLLFDDIAFKSGGTKLAVQKAFEYGMAANLGGGYHHAFPDQGRGFCVMHDIAIAIKLAQKQNLCRRVMVVDVDFHQGDGTALIFANDPSVFTLSIHSAEGWPEEKQKSDLDIEIRSNETHTYIERLNQGIQQALKSFSPDLIVFVAGSDAYELDVLEGTSFINLTLDETTRRDHLVLDTFAKLGVPLAMVFAGGYGPHVWEVHHRATKRLLEHIQK